MVIVAGHLIVDPEARPAYLAGCVPIWKRPGVAPGCLDFSLSADLTDPARSELVVTVSRPISRIL